MGIQPWELQVKTRHNTKYTANDKQILHNIPEIEQHCIHRPIIRLNSPMDPENENINTRKILNSQQPLKNNQAH